MKKKALCWAKQRQLTADFVKWIEQQGSITMAEAYRRCPNAGWAWWMLTEWCWDNIDNKKLLKKWNKIDKAMARFAEESYSQLGISWEDSREYSRLSEQTLAYWAYRLRQYVVPR